MSEHIRLEIADLLLKLEEQIYQLNSFIEENESINDKTWMIADQLITIINTTLSKLKELAN